MDEKRTESQELGSDESWTEGTQEIVHLLHNAYWGAICQLLGSMLQRQFIAKWNYY